MRRQRKSLFQADIEAKYGRPLEEVLRDLYVAKEMTVTEVAERLGYSICTISRYLNRCGIQTRQWMLPQSGSGEAVSHA